MRKILSLAMLALVGACSSTCDNGECGGCGDYSCGETYAEPRVHYVKTYERPQVRNYQDYECGDCSTGYCGCQDQVRTVREPVEVVYKNTTYKTVYKPKTYTSTNYERRPYRGERVEQKGYYRQDGECTTCR